MAELTTAAPPRVGFVGLGWIGRNRMQTAHAAGAVSVAAVADVNRESAESAGAAVGCGEVCETLEELLARELDGVVIATPTGLHAAQVRTALHAGVPVFCQKPLARTAPECEEIIALAKRRDVLLGVDMSYRHLSAVSAALEALRSDAIGRVFAAELVFHNAYGPDKPWARDPALSGGGALIDLGCHLVDLAALFLGELHPRAVHADLFAAGRHLDADPDEVEDLALAQITLADDRVIRIGCSWWLPAGIDAVIEATFYGEGAALQISNVDGSFYDFEAALMKGRQRETIAAEPDDWSGRALAAWSTRLARDRSHDPEVERLVSVAELMDRIYGRQR
jgi:predicted dehydrogenase